MKPIRVYIKPLRELREIPTPTGNFNRYWIPSMDYIAGTIIEVVPYSLDASGFFTWTTLELPHRFLADSWLVNVEDIAKNLKGVF